MEKPTIAEAEELLLPVVKNLEGFEGAVLLGSVSADMQDETSDYDLQLVFTDEALRLHPEYLDLTIDSGRRKADVWTSSLSELGALAPDSDEAKDYVNAVFLLDKAGHVKDAVRSFTAIAPEKQHDRVYTRLDAYYNALYRSLKCRRHGYEMGYYAMAVESVKMYLDVLYALNGSIAPFINRAPFLLGRLEKLPMPADTLSDILEHICRDADIPTQILLFDKTSAWMEAQGYRDVLDAWEGVLEAEVDLARLEKH